MNNNIQQNVVLRNSNNSNVPNNELIGQTYSYIQQPSQTVSQPQNQSTMLNQPNTNIGNQSGMMNPSLNSPINQQLNQSLNVLLYLKLEKRCISITYCLKQFLQQQNQISFSK